MKVNIFIAGGGSGGHIIPAIVIADELIKKIPQLQIYFLCSKNPFDRKILEESIKEYRHLNNDNFKVIPIFTGKLRRYFSWENFSDAFKFIIGIIQSFFLILKHKPVLLFSKGGFVGLTAGLGAKLKGIPIILHESDSIPGLANKILTKYGSLLLTSFPINTQQKIKSIYSGNPVRTNILKGRKNFGKKFLKFKNNDKPLVLIIGGSQGAEFLNKLTLKIYSKINANFVIICGKDKNIFPPAENLRVYEYLNQEYADILATADLVISRSGANTLNELAATGKTSIIIPLPSAANNHQLINAKYFAQTKSAILMEEKNINPAKIIQVINKLFSEPEKMLELSKNIQKHYKKDAAETASEEILKIIIKQKAKTSE